MPPPREPRPVPRPVPASPRPLPCLLSYPPPHYLHFPSHVSCFPVNGSNVAGCSLNSRSVHSVATIFTVSQGALISNSTLVLLLTAFSLIFLAPPKYSEGLPRATLSNLRTRAARKSNSRSNIPNASLRLLNAVFCGKSSVSQVSQSPPGNKTTLFRKSHDSLKGIGLEAAVWQTLLLSAA
ncbi:hypothetical protein E2C01_038839 [Portunus trituberculatus]|uniref:Uncharacterized protein n=1 Tax=Portunus trituberculatus TaxID=210409 RepID=A0A5B7FF77_PORTR|nr:hypothetical protein [Portunus trituberculatus]